MPQCSKCKKDVTWAVESARLAYQSLEVPINAGKLYGSLSAIVKDLRSSWPPVTTSRPLDTIVQSLCTACWESTMRAVASAEGKGASTYFESAAKTTSHVACGGHFPSGVYLHVDKPDFQYFPAPAENMAFALSTVVHELMHYLSKDSQGLQVDGDAVNYDECMTDYFAMKTYFATFPGMKYTTNYGPKATFLKVTKKAVWMKLMPGMLKDDMARLKTDWPVGVATYAADYLKDNPAAANTGTPFNEFKSHIARAFVYYMFRLLPMWYFGGQGQTCDEADEWLGKGASFAKFRDVVSPFVPKNNLPNGLQEYTSDMAPGGYTELFNLSYLSG